MIKLFAGLFSALALMVAGCTTTSSVMELDGGHYLISAHGDAWVGGTAGASEAAYKEAQSFCGQKNRRVVVVGKDERDIYRGGAAWGGGAGGAGMYADGRVSLRFRCAE